MGEKYWPVYFDTLRDRLKPGRHATLQIITVQDKRLEVYRRGVDFIQKYIFPGGMLPVALDPARARSSGPGWRCRGRSSSGKATARPCGAGTRRSTTAGTRWRGWALTTGSGGCGTFTSPLARGRFKGGNCDVTQITVTRPQTAP